MNAHICFQTWYNGSPKEKFSEARRIFAHLQEQQKVDPSLLAELEALRGNCQLLADQMTAMQMGPLCSACASRPGGGCCSAYMADNTDSIQILINLLLGIRIEQPQPAEDDCCFLGSHGCLFMAKPIFCLNYNCSHIASGSDPEALALLEHLTGKVLCQQTRIESIILDHLRHCRDAFRRIRL